MNEKKILIMEYIFEKDCIRICENGLFNCDFCCHMEDCYMKAKIECNENSNYILAEGINYGGYESAKEFWDELLE